MSNVNLRKALTLAIDRQGLITNVKKGEEKPGVSMVPSAVKGLKRIAVTSKIMISKMQKRHLN